MVEAVQEAIALQAASTPGRMEALAPSAFCPFSPYIVAYTWQAKSDCTWYLVHSIDQHIPQYAAGETVVRTVPQ